MTVRLVVEFTCVLTLAGLAIWTLFLFRSLRLAYARPRGYLLASLPLLMEIVAVWLWFSHRTLSLALVAIGILVASLGASMVWLVRRLHGLTPKGELWMLNLEIAKVWQEHSSTDKRGASQADKAIGLIRRIRECETPETRTFAELLALDYEDRLLRTPPSNVLAARGIRLQELARQLYPSLADAPELSSDEATFRWHLRRALGRVQEAGHANASGQERKLFLRLAAELDPFRRDDTDDLITAVQASAHEWAQAKSSDGWVGNEGVWRIDPQVNRLFLQFCPSIKTLSGAGLDPEDKELIYRRDYA